MSRRDEGFFQEKFRKKEKTEHSPCLNFLLFHFPFKHIEKISKSSPTDVQSPRRASTGIAATSTKVSTAGTNDANVKRSLRESKTLFYSPLVFQRKPPLSRRLLLLFCGQFSLDSLESVINGFGSPSQFCRNFLIVLSPQVQGQDGLFQRTQFFSNIRLQRLCLFPS